MSREQRDETVVQENAKIAINQLIREFQHSDNWEFAFPPTLTKAERAFVHQCVRRKGYSSHSDGNGDKRRITVYKRNHNRGSSKYSQLLVINQWLTLTPLSKSILRCYMEAIYPDPGNVRSFRRGPEQNTCGGLLNLPSISAELIPPESNESKATFEERIKLPIYPYREDILDCIGAYPIMIVNGDTGSGKTTQVPQYIIEDAKGKNFPCRIICTQPRRMAAVTIAERVAKERGEKLGATVGYQIRLDRCFNKKTNLIYTTSGCVLRSLMNNVQNTFHGLTHIIIDEIHERDKNTDFILIALREQLLNRTGLRVILMSATMDLQLLSSYFYNVPIINVPGRCYEIENYYLEDILYQTKFKSGVMKVYMEQNNHKPWKKSLFEPKIDMAQQNIVNNLIDCCLNERTKESITYMWKVILNQGIPINATQSTTYTTPLQVAVQLNNCEYVEKFLKYGADKYMVDCNDLTAFDYAKKLEDGKCLDILQGNAWNNKDDLIKLKKNRWLETYQKYSDDDEVDHNLLLTLIRFIISQNNPGSILIFLPGYNDIVLQKDIIMENLPLNSFKLFLLHSNMKIEDQQQVLASVSVRKIILSTNIGETSITFPDIAYVIDSGKVKENTYDSLTSTSYLKSTWISQACAKQRAGRAGRTQKGTCYHMYSREKYEGFNKFAIPEFLRIPLTEICLYAKAISPSSPISDYLSKALQPPSHVNIHTAVNKLKMIGALNDTENMTELGQHLVEMPLEVQLGKSVLFSILLKCLDPILTIVAFHSVKDPFALPADRYERDKASAKRKLFSANSYSDHMGIVNMYRTWRAAKTHGSMYERKFCSENFLTKSTLEMMHATRKQIYDHVKRTYNLQENLLDVNINSNVWNLVQMCLVAGLYPNIGFVDRNRAKITSGMEHSIVIHPSSSLRPIGIKDIRQSINQLPHEWIAFYEKTRTSAMANIKHNTMVSQIIIAITCGMPTTKRVGVIGEMRQLASCFGGDFMLEDDDKLIIDNWIQFLISEDDKFLLTRLKNNFNNAMSEFLLNGRIIHKESCDQLIEIVKAVLQNELGMEQVHGAGSQNPHDSVGSDDVMANIGHFLSLNVN